MTVFYFTSTGNSLAVAKKIGGKLISIPQIIDDDNLYFKDDVIGLVFPIYSIGLPKVVLNFLKKATWEADYAFAVGTYGRFPGASVRNVQRFIRKRGNRLDYAQHLLMVDNFLPAFEVNSEIAKLPQKKTEENLAQIVSDIQSRKQLEAKASLVRRIASSIIKGGEKIVLRDKQAQRYTVNENCVKCGVCAKVCPAGNISVTDKVVFGSQCEWCLGCLHHCPKNALHMKQERSAARWRNPDVSLGEIIAANNRRKN